MSSYMEELEDVEALIMMLPNFFGAWTKNGSYDFKRYSFTSFQILFALYLTMLDMIMAYPDLFSITRYFCFFTATTLGFIKFINFMIQKKKFLEMNTFIKTVLWLNPEGVPENEDIIRTANKQAKKYAMAIIIFVEATVIFCLLEPLFKKYVIGQSGELKIGNKTSTKELPFEMYFFPFGLDPNESPLYEVIYAVEVCASTYAAAVIATFDNVFIFYVLNAVGQFKLLENNIRSLGRQIDGGEGARSKLERRRGSALNLDKYEGQRRESDAIASLLQSAITQCVTKHQQIIQFSNDCEGLFSWTTLYHFCIMSLIICSCGFQLITMKGNPFYMLTFVAYMSACLTDIYMFCWVCNELIISSTDISMAVFSWNWFNYPRHFKTFALLMMQRAQKPVRLTAGKFYSVSFETFSTILSTAGSYLTLLRAMHEED